jgi:glycosyltransferase involved in cell wall biosynthesis
MAGSRKWISVIIPCYNVERYIQQCIESVLNQTIGFENIQLILIDDASTDSTAEQLANYVVNYPQSIELIRLKENKGQANARNIGIEQAEASYLVFIDSDDWISTDFCEKMLSITFTNECDLIHCGFIQYRGKGNEKEIREGLLKNGNKLIELRSIEDRKQFIKERTFSGVIGRTVFRTEWLKGNNFRFINFRKYEDNHFQGIVQYQFKKIYLVAESLYYYRLLDESNSHSRNNVEHFERLKIELELIKYYQENGIFEIYYEEIRREFLLKFYINTLHIIFCQFDSIPLELISDMKQTVRELFPDYLKEVKYNNSLLQDLILTIEYDFPLEEWQKIKDCYLGFFRENNMASYLFYLGKLWRTWAIAQIEKR